MTSVLNIKLLNRASGVSVSQCTDHVILVSREDVSLNLTPGLVSHVSPLSVLGFLSLYTRASQNVT